jgi:hypothetical protein
MAIINKGKSFSNGEQLTADKLNQVIDDATFTTSAVDNVSTQISGGGIIVKDGGITPSKLSTGAPQWDSNGKLKTGKDTGDGFPRTHITASRVGITDTLELSANDAIIFKTTYPNEHERMRINNQGIVLVGTTDINPYDNATSAGIALHGAGSSQAGLITSARVNSTAAAFNRIGTNGSVVNFRKDGSSVGSISVTASSTAYNTSSDYRLKEDIIELDDSTERLKTLKPCNFRWKADGTRVDGFIAHEAQEVVPEAVTGTKDAVDEEGNPDYQGIDQSKLVPLLTKALQEAVAKIESLEARVTALES